MQKNRRRSRQKTTPHRSQDAEHAPQSAEEEEDQLASSEQEQRPSKKLKQSQSQRVRRTSRQQSQPSDSEFGNNSDSAAGGSEAERERERVQEEERKAAALLRLVQTGNGNPSPEPSGPGSDVTPRAVNPYRQNRNATGQRMVWTAPETECLIECLKRFGAKWRQIIAAFGANGSEGNTLKYRTNVSVKDKASNMKTAYIREGRKVPSWLADGECPVVAVCLRLELMLPPRYLLSQ